MPSETKQRTPSYRRHRASGQAVVTLSGRDFYLGPWKSAASRAEYDQLVGEWLASGRQLDGTGTDGDLTVNELIVHYWDHAKTYYRKADGTATSEINNIENAMRSLRRLYGDTLARDFGPRALESVRGDMVRAGWCRKVVNRRVGVLKRMFRWAVAKEFLAPERLVALDAVAGLKKDRCDVRETKPVKPVPEDVVEATLPFVSRQVGALIRLQLLTGMRPGEAILMRGVDLDRSGTAWLYSPAHHKLAHLGQERPIFIGPKAQAIVLPFLLRDANAYLFSPSEAEIERNAAKRASRHSPMTPSQWKRNRRARPGDGLADRYDVAAYRRAIHRAVVRVNKPIEKANESRPEGSKLPLLPLWHPNQLRHTAATKLRKEHGLDVAAAVLGHRMLETTQIYAEKDLQKAASIMAQVG